MSRLAGLLALILAACHQPVLPPQGSLEGLTLPLLSSPALKVAVGGSIAGQAAVVQLDPGNPLSFITRGCLETRTRTGRVTVADPFGPDETFPTLTVAGLTLGEVRLKPFDAGIAEGPGCVLVLGEDVLHGLALDVKVGARTVTLLRSAPVEHWLSLVEPGEEVQALALTKDPRRDWPLLAVRVTQGQTTYTGSLLFSARESRTRLYESAAREAGLKPGIELLQGLALPAGVTLPAPLQALRGFAVDRVELAPGFGTGAQLVELEAGSPVHAAQGVLGTDVWGHFNALIDTTAGVVVLHRPRVLMSGERAQCERGGQVSEEACFEFAQRKTAKGFELGAAVWRPLPDGAHLVFDVTAPSPLPCHLGFTFSPGDRGRGTFHELPWARLEQVMPECAAALGQATAIAPGFFEDRPLPGCPGTCAFAQDLKTNRLTCECQATHPSLDEDAERELLRLYRSLLEGAPAPVEPEPSDPE